MIHQPLSTGRVHPQISSSLTLLVYCLVRPDLFVIYYCLFIFVKELVSFIGSLDKCHTSVFNALIYIANPFIVSKCLTLSCTDQVLRRFDLFYLTHFRPLVWEDCSITAYKVTMEKIAIVNTFCLFI